MAVSLLDGRHTVTVTPKVAAGKDSVNGTRYVDGTPVLVKCNVQPIGTDEANNIDLQVHTVYRVVGRGAWPGGSKATISWNGRPFDQLGEALVYSMSPRTGHYELLMQAQEGPV